MTVFPCIFLILLYVLAHSPAYDGVFPIPTSPDIFSDIKNSFSSIGYSSVESTPEKKSDILSSSSGGSDYSSPSPPAAPRKKLAGTRERKFFPTDSYFVRKDPLSDKKEVSQTSYLEQVENSLETTQNDLCHDFTRFYVSAEGRAKTSARRRLNFDNPLPI